MLQYRERCRGSVDSVVVEIFRRVFKRGYLLISPDVTGTHGATKARDTPPEMAFAGASRALRAALRRPCQIGGGLVQARW